MKRVKKNEEEKNNKTTLKKPVAVGMILFGAASFLASSFMGQEHAVDKIVSLILGILCFSMGIGLFILSNCEDMKDSIDSVNMFIGKELFEKGLYGILIGVVLWLLEKI